MRKDEESVEFERKIDKWKNRAGKDTERRRNPLTTLERNPRKTSSPGKEFDVCVYTL